MTDIGGDITVQVLPGENGRPRVVISQVKGPAQLGVVTVTHASHLQALIRALKSRLDIILEETRARVRPEACHGGGQVPRRPALDEDDGA